MNDHLSDYTDDERRRFASLPRTASPDPRIEDAIVAQLSAEGLLRAPRPRAYTAGWVALAAGLIIAAWFAGARHGVRTTYESSIEGLLVRDDLTDAERVLLMQRAGSAYVAAANAYASAVKTTDAAASEVSNQVLMGAAQAIARTKLDGPLPQRLASLLGEANRPTPKAHPVIWY
jgi:hypothetical protein